MAHIRDARQNGCRILAIQLDRAAKTLQGTVTRSMQWAVAVAFLCSDLLPPPLAAVPLPRSAEFAAAIIVPALVTGAAMHVVLRWYADADEERRLVRRLHALLPLTAFISTAWGLALWLLWLPGNVVNHVFIVLIALAIVSRFLVNRANYTAFFLASFLPMASLLFLRCVLDFNAAGLVLGALIPIHAVQILFDSHAISTRWDDEAGLRLSYEDISRQLGEARDEALAKRAEAEAANASKTAFLANMSHELRTPLNAILGFSEIIADETLGPAGAVRYREYAGDIHHAGRHLLSLINDLLDVAKIESGRMEIEPETIETARALDAALMLLGARARERSQTLTIDVTPDAASLYADKRALTQIVVNLVSNAVKFTPLGGRIAVTVRRDSHGDFELAVADNGAGIPHDVLERIFQPFVQGDNHYGSKSGGTGLGLALVRGLAELHGGRVRAESGQGEGARIVVTLPTAANGRHVPRGRSAA